MSESEPSNAVSAEAQRMPIMQQLGTSIQYMRASANTESKRAGDLQNAMLLPISCLLLVAAICLSCPPQLRMLAFCVPLFCFMYYIARRIGVVRTMTPRQAYLTWHVLIATLLFGGTAALFLVYAGTSLMLYATHGQ